MAARRSTPPPKRKGFARELAGLACLFLSAFLFLSILSFHANDPSFNQAVSKGWKVQNVVGVAGSYSAGLLVELFGLGALVWPFYFLYLGLSRFIRRIRLSRLRWLGICSLFLAFEAWASHPWFVDLPPNAYGLIGGGWVGRALSSHTLPYLRPVGAFLLWLFISIASLQMTLGFSWASLWKRLMVWWEDYSLKRGERRERSRRMKLAKAEEKAARKLARQQEAEARAEAEELAQAEAEASGFREENEEAEDDLVLTPLAEESKPKRKKAAAKKKPAKSISVKPGEMPGTDLLSSPPEQGNSVDMAILDAQAVRLKDCLADFNVQGEMHRVVPGPVVTMFEFKPAPGIKVSKIENLTDDIALALKAESVRIEAPIPGKDSVGIEIPNPSRQTIYLREVLESKEFQSSKSPLTLALGKDIHGATKVADLSKMPHLLVAGATGAGKSVGINGFLLSMLYKASPEELKLLLVDPKRIELAPYAQLPHLVHPVVTEMSMAKSALEWAVFEMDCRYQKMAKLGVRNIEGFNKRIQSGSGIPEEAQEWTPLPYLVIIIDELADLMMTAAKDVEQCIVRLAQLARAAGIHMILATQRPSVDVVTGLIKANFPTRISFFVTSKFDSRTILDSVGAERLLGRGDMLFKPSGGKLKRMHGAFVDEAEIAGVVNFWKEMQPQEFDLDFADWKKDSGDSNGGGGVSNSDDPVYNEAVQFVMDQGKASISLLQRRFRIGFNRAARYIEQMEMDGLLGPQEGSKPRKVINPE
ncbi:DNA translocase FtsK [Pseudodesulfovibrio tunisiensis]|uniref:DNA translocase FtsK n=1 Tax=Pseudodesulfovibrio tunisiensis TaxID=463192 RepID=UPI001FB508F0|nr:DNA translocase FtsK [Pseudodesulfovibrio tunisiensis]